MSLSMYSQKYSSDYIEKMNNTINVKFSLDNDIESFQYISNDEEYIINPNTNIRTTLHANYRFLSFKIGYSPRILSGHDEDNKGKTKVFKIQSDIYIKNFMQTFEYSKIKGYYADNINQPSEFEFIILPHLQTSTFRSTTRYKFNEDYSLKALLTQTEIQRKSAGSIISSLSFYKSDLINKDGVKDLFSKGIYVNTGYFYTLVINHRWYSNLGISPGLGIEFNKINTKIDEDIITDNQTGIIASLNSEIGFGYNSDKFYSGLDFRLNAIYRSEDSVADFDTVRGIFNVFIGYRFGSPRLIEDSMDWLEDKNPLK